MVRSWWARTPLALLAVGAVGCGPGGEGERVGPPFADAVEIVTLGAVDHPVLGFASVSGLAVGEDLYVLQANVPEVTVLTRSGELLYRIGKRGQGPGEFATPSGLGLRGDTLWVMDNVNRRVSYFVEGRLVAEAPFRHGPLPEGHNLGVFLPLADGAFLAMLTRSFRETPRSPENAFPLIRVEGRALTDTLALLFEASPFRVYWESSTGRTSVSPLFSDFPMLSLSPLGEALVTVDRPIPHTGEAELVVTRVGALGDTIYRRVIRRPAVPLPKETWDSVLRARLGERPRRFTLEEYEAAAERALAYPPGSRVLSDGAGHVWIAFEVVPGRETVEWMRLDPSGVPELTTRLPASFRAYAVHRDEVWGVVGGAYDEPYVRGYQVVVGGDAP